MSGDEQNIRELGQTGTYSFVVFGIRALLDYSNQITTETSSCPKKKCRCDSYNINQKGIEDGKCVRGNTTRML